MHSGTKIRIIETCHGCRGAEGLVGVVTNKISTDGLLQRDPGYNVETRSGVWRINHNAIVEVLHETAKVPAETADIAEINRVMFRNPATVVFWSDGTKTVVRCQPGDVYNPDTGLALCVAKKYFGNTGKFNEVFKKYLGEA